MIDYDLLQYAANKRANIASSPRRDMQGKFYLVREIIFPA